MLVGIIPTITSLGGLLALRISARDFGLILLYMKGAEKIKKLEKIVSASNERQLSRDTGTILEYTNVPGPNQGGSSWD